MTFKRLAILCCFLGLLATSMQAQTDTLKIMQYNLLYYGDNSCRQVTEKDAFLSQILPNYLPDVFCVNELSNNAIYADRILANVLNINGVTRYARATYTNNASSTIVNMLFYNSDKLAIHSEAVIANSIRDINVYTLYYKDQNLAVTQDTVFLTFIVGHLKAGSTTSDQSDRAVATQQIMTYLDGLGKPGNYFVMGDFNTDASSEQCYQNLVSHSNSQTKMYDPITTPGTWSSNSTFAAVHTQSPRVTNNDGDCGTGGGLDDRLDFILTSDYVINDSARVKYVPGSYLTIGQDGQRYNQSVNSPANTQVSSTVANALYGASDHLPVMMKVRINPMPLSAVAENYMPGLKFAAYQDDISGDYKVTVFAEQQMQNCKLKVTDLQGKTLFSTEINLQTGENAAVIPSAAWSSGLYILHIQKDMAYLGGLKILKM